MFDEEGNQFLDCINNVATGEFGLSFKYFKKLQKTATHEKKFSIQVM